VLQNISRLLTLNIRIPQGEMSEFIRNSLKEECEFRITVAVIADHSVKH